MDTFQAYVCAAFLNYLISFKFAYFINKTLKMNKILSFTIC